MPLTKVRMNKLLLILILGLVYSASAQGQSVARQTIQVAGKSVHSGPNVVMQSSTGQSSPTQNRQGFIQPPYFVQTKGKNILRVYPSPTLGISTVEFDFESSDQLQVIDMNGRLVVSEIIQNTESKKELDLSGFASGKYIIRILRRGDNEAEGSLLKIK